MFQEFCVFRQLLSCLFCLRYCSLWALIGMFAGASGVVFFSYWFGRVLFHTLPPSEMELLKAQVSQLWPGSKRSQTLSECFVWLFLFQSTMTK